MLSNLCKTPFPYFGGKSDAAPYVWNALGDPHHYLEPFAGSLAVLLRRPHPANRTHYSETINDADGLLINVWRSIQWSPGETAKYASWPVTEADLHARHIALLKWRNEHQLEHLMGDYKFHDPEMAGFWIWGNSCWIGSGFCSGDGAWTVDPQGRLIKGKSTVGISRQISHLGGVGKGVNNPCARELGIARQIPSLSDGGTGVNNPCVRTLGTQNEDNVFHPMTSSEVLRWFQFLSARLRNVRIINGDWTRCVTHGVIHDIDMRKNPEAFAGIFLDPPYDEDIRHAGVYTHDGSTQAIDTHKWCIENGANPQYRIVLAGYDTEHTELENYGWTAIEWFKAGYMKGGMAMTSSKGQNQQHRERLWLSPNCIKNEETNTLDAIFAEED